MRPFWKRAPASSLARRHWAGNWVTQSFQTEVVPIWLVKRSPIHFSVRVVFYSVMLVYASSIPKYILTPLKSNLRLLLFKVLLFAFSDLHQLFILQEWFSNLVVSFLSLPFSQKLFLPEVSSIKKCILLKTSFLWRRYFFLGYTRIPIYV